MGVDDFIARLEMALAAYGFTGDNAIGECVCSRSFEPTTCRVAAGAHYNLLSASRTHQQAIGTVLAGCSSALGQGCSKPNLAVAVHQHLQANTSRPLYQHL